MLVLFWNTMASLNASVVNAQNALDRKISIELKNVVLKDALNRIADLANISFVYISNNALDKNKVSLSARNRDGKVELRVADTGQGLTPEECERLFTPYYTTKLHGTGLGLAIVQSVIADHAGTITVESCEGQGATFVITLPRAEG